MRADADAHRRSAAGSAPPRRAGRGTARRALAAALALLLAGCLGPPPEEAERQVAAFLQEVLDGLLARDPEWASELRLFDGPVDPGGARLTDVSPDAQRERQAFLEAASRRARHLPLRGISPELREAHAALRWYLEDAERGGPFLFHDFPINPVFGVQNRLVALMTQVHPVRNEAEAADYVARLRAIGGKIDGLIEGSRLRAERGIVPPRVAVERVKAQIDAFLWTPLGEIPFQAALRRKLEAADLPPAVQAAWRGRAAAAIRDEVLPAWERLYAEVERLEARATPDIGVWQLPDGDAWYRHLVRHHTTLDTTPEDLHALGRAEVARIQAELRRIHEARGVAPGLSFEESLSRYYDGLPQDGSLSYPDDAAGRVAALSDYEALVRDASARLAPLFEVVPDTPVVVRRIPAAVEASTPAHYRAPSFDGQRPGVFYANLAQPPWRPGMPTLTYHETVPGHHFHLARVREQPGLAPTLRVVGFTAHVEGWALYAERLAREQGFLDDPLALHESLWSELFRAARLVVDTGIHHRRWSREQALDYMRATLGSSMELEVDRYAVMPGQALAYKAGELEIVRLRERARRRLGDDFELPLFHEAVIGGGHLPLPVLARRVEQRVRPAAGGRSSFAPIARGPVAAPPRDREERVRGGSPRPQPHAPAPDPRARM